MLLDFEPNTQITGGPISGTDAKDLEFISDLMNRVFDYVCNQQEVNLKELVVFMN